MKHPTPKNLNVISSWLLGITGAGMVLVPFYFEQTGTSMLKLGLAVLGIFCFLTSLLNQITFISKVSRKRARVYKSLSILFLLSLAVFFIVSGFVVEGCIFGFVGIIRLVMVSPLKKQFAQVDPLHMTLILCGFSGGIYLALSDGQYGEADISAVKNILAGLFLATSTFEILRKHIFPEKSKTFLSRVQAIPWLAWCLIFLHTLSIAHLAAPALLATAILVNGLFPWERLKLQPNDIIGNRAVNITVTLAATLLIFLFILLTAMDANLKGESAALVSTRNWAFLFFGLVSMIMYYEVITLVMTINGLLDESDHEKENPEQPSTDPSLALWNSKLEGYLKPFTHNREELQRRLNAQSDQISLLSRHLQNEKKRSAQITLLMELSQQLENQLEKPVAAQLTVNSLERALNSNIVCIFEHEPDRKEFTLLAAAGDQNNLVPSGFRQNISVGMLGRAMRQRKTQVSNDVRMDADYIPFENEKSLSAVVIPLIFNGYVNGAIALSSETLNAYNSTDVWLAEMAAAELTRAWERSRYHQRLMTLVQTGSQISAMVQPETTASEVAAIAREILQARFTFVKIHLGQDKNFMQSAFSGKAPRLQESLENSATSEALIEIAFHAVQPFRVRDIRKYSPTSHLDIDHAGLRSMLAIPIQWGRLNIGTILAFGKQNEVFFNENDQSLAELLSIQAGGAFESAWLQQELRGSLRTTSLLYRLSTQIIQTDNFQTSAEDIVRTAHKIAKSSTTGIVLVDKQGETIAEAQVNESDILIGLEHPMGIIKDVLESGQTIYLSQGNSIMRACLPIQTSILKYGVLWLDIQEEPENKSVSNPNDLQALVAQTAVALERSMLLLESRRQAAAIKEAYDKLEATYDQTLAALMSALDARDRETEGHSSRVSQLTAELGKALNFSHEQLKVLERGSLLHDIGKIGVSDTILHKPGPLTEEEWIAMRCHPDIGAKIVAGIPFLEDTIPLIRHHQERWDGTGYPDKLRGEEIPILARMFSIVDAFDALTSKRPYRKKISTLEAVEYINEQAGILFDPEVVEVFKKLAIENQSGLFSTEQT